MYPIFRVVGVGQVGRAVTDRGPSGRWIRIVRGVPGDRVVITLDGKFLPYEWPSS
jgi:hypothetical protein